MYESDAFDHIIAVDGGLRSLEEVGVKPDVALGDFAHRALFEGQRQI